MHARHIATDTSDRLYVTDPATPVCWSGHGGHRSNEAGSSFTLPNLNAQGVIVSYPSLAKSG